MTPIPTNLHTPTGDITCLDPALHSEVELLLENYHRQLVLIGAQINILRQRVSVCVHRGGGCMTVHDGGGGGGSGGT
jgi:hypothetical protein